MLPTAPQLVGVAMRRATAETWAASELVMLKGEAGRDVTNLIVKYGDGVHVWRDLPVAFQAGVSSTPTGDGDWPDLTLLAEAAMQ